MPPPANPNTHTHTHGSPLSRIHFSDAGWSSKLKNCSSWDSLAGQTLACCERRNLRCPFTPSHWFVPCRLFLLMFVLCCSLTRGSRKWNAHKIHNVLLYITSHITYGKSPWFPHFLSLSFKMSNFFAAKMKESRTQSVCATLLITQ